MLSVRSDVSLSASAASILSCPGGIFQQSRLRAWSEGVNKSTRIDVDSTEDKLIRQYVMLSLRGELSQSQR